MSLTRDDKSMTELIGLEGLLPPGMRLLASCFDAHHTIGGGLFAVESTVDQIDSVSSAGLAVDDGQLLRCLWSADGSPAELVVYDNTGVRRYHRLDGVSTPHDILAVDEGVLVVATMQNEVQCIAPDGTIAWRWQAPGEPDSWHLNSLAHFGDRVVVCGFGPFLRRRGWDANGKPATGRVVDLGTGEPVLDGLRAPHNPWYTGKSWLVCDSAAGDLLEISPEGGEALRRCALPGWPRGLAVTDRYLFVGLSPHRHAALSVETAAVAVIDRADWRPVGVVQLPAREIYALALAPAELVDGARKGFGANHTRVHEQGQRQLFDRIGARPRRLWAIGDPLSEDECQARLTFDGPVPEQAESGGLLTVDCLVHNTGPGVLTPAPPFPVRVVHSWFDDRGEPVDTQVWRAALPRSLPPDAVTRVPVRARVPAQPGRYRLRITLAQDGGASFDEIDPASAVETTMTVVPDRAGADALTRFGLYPAQIWAAIAEGDTVEDAVRGLLTRSSGEPNGLTIALIAELGTDAFVEAVATTLRCSIGAIDHLVREIIPPATQVRLTGAEAVALGLRRAGVRVAFAYAGTSELALCDAFARLALLVNGRGDKEALFEAGGASRLRPGNGAAILHGARGLTNALGALADLRRNEAGTVAVVGLPSTGSQPFLPPHGEPGLIATAGQFAKSWYELGAVPADPQPRAAAVDAFIAALVAAVRDATTAPFGPSLLAIPQDVAEAAWVPLSALPETIQAYPVPRADVRAALGGAGELVAAAKRPVVLIDDYAFASDGLRAALNALCERTGAPVLQVKYRRGPMIFERLRVSEVPAFIGWYHPNSPAHQSIMDSADLLITVEDRNMYPRVLGELPACRTIALTTKPDATAKNGYLGEGDLLVATDVVAALEVLADAVEPATRPALWYRELLTGANGAANGLVVPEAAATVRSGIATALRAVVERLTTPAVLVDDSQMFGGLLAEEYDLLPEDLRVFGGHGGFVGSGIAIATGLAVGEPSAKVICTIGDQGFTNAVQGLVAAVQESAPVTFLVCNNGGSVSLRKQSHPAGWLDAGHHVYLENAAGADYTAVASAIGVRASKVDLSGWLDRDQVGMRLDTLREALAGAVEHQGPTLIELVLPSDPEFWTGVWITEGFERRGTAAARPAEQERTVAASNA
ncbi:MAG TPA: DUF4915 domain-containing protein [Pseudonocardiaceae bacterium]|jgi:acetolactate synthase-1/2/3 large subunit